MKKILSILLGLITLFSCSEKDEIRDDIKAIGFDLIKHPEKVFDLATNFHENYDENIIMPEMKDKKYLDKISKSITEYFNSNIENISVKRYELMKPVDSWKIGPIDLKDIDYYYSFCKDFKCLSFIFYMKDDDIFILLILDD